jgi:glutamate-1-semialdehyde 2,1-aminomutase
VTAGTTTLKELQKPGTYERLESLSQRLTKGLTQVFNQWEVPSSVNRVGSMFTGFFTPKPVDTLAQVEKSDTAKYRKYFHAMLNRGVYLAPSQFEAGFVSLAHTEADIDRTVEVAQAALKNLQ